MVPGQTVMMACVHDRSSDDEERVLAAYRRLKSRARTDAVTGSATIKFQLVRGGVHKEFEVTWSERIA